MYVWQQHLKRLIDVITSIVVLVLFLPVLVCIALIVGLTSRGPIIYSQERVGHHMVPFRIYKFRTMINNAEQSGPQLSNESDDRITGAGRFLRRLHLDELPQFYNVLKGDMSIVGPRPERPYYVNQILKFNPDLGRLYSVRPGITSWGQVKYGYASSLDEIIKRTKFDLLYLDNRSLFLDFRIIILTIKVIMSGSK
jgi:lipopolysaccharide/colanic/teichoic acid biosynthesis glycosyltransferase